MYTKQKPVVRKKVSFIRRIKQRAANLIGQYNNRYKNTSEAPHVLNAQTAKQLVINRLSNRQRQVLNRSIRNTGIRWLDHPMEALQHLARTGTMTTPWIAV